MFYEKRIVRGVILRRVFNNLSVRSVISLCVFDIGMLKSMCFTSANTPPREMEAFPVPKRLTNVQRGGLEPNSYKHNRPPTTEILTRGGVDPHWNDISSHSSYSTGSEI